MGFPFEYDIVARMIAVSKVNKMISGINSPLYFVEHKQVNTTASYAGLLTRAKYFCCSNRCRSSSRALAEGVNLLWGSFPVLIRTSHSSSIRRNAEETCVSLFSDIR